MHDKFSRRIEAALAKLAARIEGSSKRLDAAQVNRQIGRILQRNQRAAARFFAGSAQAAADPRATAAATNRHKRRDIPTA